MHPYLYGIVNDILPSTEEKSKNIWGECKKKRKPSNLRPVTAEEGAADIPAGGDVAGPYGETAFFLAKISVVWYTETDVDTKNEGEYHGKDYKLYH